MRVAIVTAGDGWDRAPFDDPGVEIWACNDFYRLPFPRVTRIWEMHREEDWLLSDETMLSCDVPRGKYWRPTGHRDTLNGYGVPIYMQEASPHFPTSVPYPIQQSSKASGGVMLFDGSISYMLGLCLIERPIWIGLYGANMAGAEYADQRPNVQWFLGVACGLGINLHIEPPSALLSCSHLYAYEPVPQSLPDDLRRELVRVVNEREQLVQAWIDGATPHDDSRQRVRVLDHAIGVCHAQLAGHALTPSQNALQRAVERTR